MISRQILQECYDTITIDYTEIGKLTENQPTVYEPRVQKAQNEFIELVQKKFSYTAPAIKE